MPDIAFAAPILPGKLEAWKRFAAELQGSRRKDYEASRLRAGIIKEEAWLQRTPQGDMVVVLQEAEDPAAAMQAIAASKDPFDQWFRAQVKDIHGMDLSAPPAPSQAVVQWQSPRYGVKLVEQRELGPD